MRFLNNKTKTRSDLMESQNFMFNFIFKFVFAMIIIGFVGIIAFWVITFNYVNENGGVATTAGKFYKEFKAASE